LVIEDELVDEFIPGAWPGVRGAVAPLGAGEDGE
jgi:hypothetical protein